MSRAAILVSSLKRSLPLKYNHNSLWRNACPPRTITSRISPTSARLERARRYCTAPSAIGCDDFERELREFKLPEKPEYFNFAVDVIDEWAKKDEEVGNKSHLAFWWVDDNGNEVKWTYKELSEQAKRASNVLSGNCHLEPDDRVVAVLPRLPEWWLLNLACIRTGTVLIPGTTQLTAKDIRYRLQRSKAKCIIVDVPTAEKVDEVIADCPDVRCKIIVEEYPGQAQQKIKQGWTDFKALHNVASPNHQAARTKSDDAMTIFFTSGTTGEPKMAEHTHASYGIGHIITARFYLDLAPNDIMWNWSDTGWAKSAYSNVFAPWIAGACVFIHHTPKFEPLAVLKHLESYPVSVFCAAPTLYRMLIQEDVSKFTFPNLRHCVSAGEPLNPEVTHSWNSATGHMIREGYGQTETVLSVGTPRCIPCKPGSMGKPTPGQTILVLDENLQECPPWKEGAIAIKVKPDRPIGMFSKYVNEPERTAAAFKGDYFLSGDRCMRDDDGYFWFVGRDDDVIISAGYRIGPFEVESALIEHPAVAESAVVSSPDNIRGQVVKAFVLLTPGYSRADDDALKKDLQEHVKNLTAPYKYPRKIEFVDSLPKTVSGKIRRIELRDKEWGN